jgi:aldehyde:ferredoxin oxidoreductase
MAPNAAAREGAYVLKGYQGKILRVDLADRTFREEPVDERDLAAFLGGRGLAARYYQREIDAATDPLGPANRLIFMTGPLTATPLFAVSRFQLATRSPETRLYLCSNCGGDFGFRLKLAGWDGLVVEGAAADWTWLAIADGTVRFIDAGPWRGSSAARTVEAMRAEFGGRDAGAMAVGPAAERLVRISCITADGRAFGRGGPGAVMRSKRLKGLIVRGSGAVALADPARVAESRRGALASAGGERERRGTTQYVEPLNELGCMPTRNFQTASFEAIDAVDPRTAPERPRVRDTACAGCPVACGKSFEVTAGRFAGARARTEFEAIALLGPNCGISDFGAIVRANQLCDELGVDTMSAGNAVALVMELAERGMLSREDTDGLEVRFGSADALFGVLRLIAERRGVGDLLAEGMHRVKRARPEWAPYILDVKGMPLAGYDPRGFHGSGLTYGTSSRGACHNTGGWTIRAELQDPVVDRYALRGKGALVKAIQDGRAYLDSVGMCSVVRAAFGFTDTPTGDVLEAVTGHPFTPHLAEIAERIYSLERIILNREGIRRADDMLPERIMREKVPSGPTKGRILTAEMYGVMLDEYYAARGWDADGVVTVETRRRLDLE